MKRIAGIALVVLAAVFTTLSLLLVSPNDMVEFFAGLLGSVAMMQLAFGLVAVVCLGGALSLLRPHAAWLRAATGVLAVVLTLVAAMTLRRDFGRYSRENTIVLTTTDTLTATIYRPRGEAELRPAVLILHGSGDMPRRMYHFMARRFAERGFVVLNADKRGVGGSTGRYYGDDLGRDKVIEKRAIESRAALAQLANQPGVDPNRIGVVTISQGGWVMASLLDGTSPARFAINLSGPAVSSAEEGAWSEWTEENKDHFGMKPPPIPFEELDRRIQSIKPGAYDPRAPLATMTLPSLWLYGEWDSSQPVRPSIAVLDSLIERGKPITWRLFKEANHGLFVVRGPNGSRMAKYAPGVWDSVFAWTDRQGITRR